MSKQEQWEKIKKEAPEIANFITMVSKEFGKPKAVGVRIDGEIILNHGEWQRVRDFSIKRTYRRW